MRQHLLTPWWALGVMLCSIGIGSTLLADSSDPLNDCFKFLRTSVHFRSQGANTAREWVGWQWELNKPEMCENYGVTYFAFEYQRSFRDEELATALFGRPCLNFAGSQVPNRSQQALLADNFGLARNFEGSIHLKPRVENYIFDIGLDFGLDSWIQGLWLRFHAPFVHARWTIDADCGTCENIEEGAARQFAPCYMAQGAVDTATDLKQALSGAFLFGDMQTPWEGGRFDFSRRTRNGLADIDVMFGYNVRSTDAEHLGLFVMGVLPTGKRRQNLFVLDPVVGNGKHFELGGGLSAHKVFWSGEDANMALFFIGNITHMFSSEQCRTFDLVNAGPLSRYVLLKEYDTDGSQYTYNGNLISANSFTTRHVDVSLSAKGDATLKLAYRWCGLGVDVGYNIYGHSEEQIELRCDACADAIERRNFGIKGTSGVACNQYIIAQSPPPNSVPTIYPAGTNFPEGATEPQGCDPLPPTSTVTKQPSQANQPGATAFTPGMMPQGRVTVPPDCTVCLNEGTVNAPTPISSLTSENGFFIDNTLQPQLIATKDLDICSGQAHSVLTHKFFVFANYTWMDECGWNPRFGGGFSVEFDGNHGRSGCERTGLNQWGILLKGGFSF